MQNTGSSGGASGSDTGVVHYYAGQMVKHVNVPPPPPPSQQMSATNKQEGTTPQEVQAVEAQGVNQTQGVNQAPSNTPPTPPTPQAAHAAMDQTAQAAHGHVQSGPPQAVTPKAKGKVPPQFQKKK